MTAAQFLIDTSALAKMSTELERESGAKAKEIHELAGTEFNIGSPKQLADVLFNRLNLPKPVKYGRGKVTSTAVDVLEARDEGVFSANALNRELALIDARQIGLELRDA